ncbi:MAG: hypothetical protein N2Z21_00125 [Candidatus Sumerlaeaceae bacterium]|nr:hypothetical protein [Candidatus Sumerlaeaceae bacterium]
MLKASSIYGRIFAVIRTHWLFALVMSIVMTWNLVLRLHAEPNVFPDGAAYGMLACEMLEGKFSNDLFAFRTPGFPAFLAVVFAFAGKENWQAVISVQFLLGTFIPFGLYLLFLPITKRPWLAALAAGAYLLDRYFLALQAVPLTEFLGGACAVFVLAWHVWAWRRMRWAEAIFLGLATGYWILVRPSFQLLPWCLALAGFLLVFWDRVGVRNLWKRLVLWHLAYLAAYQLPLLFWSAHIYRLTGHWGLSHQLGASLTNHTGAFMEFAPDHYGPLKEIYVSEKRRRGGNWINVFDSIYPELTSATKWRRSEISLAYKEIDKYLLRRFWKTYLDNVNKSWYYLWTEPSSYLVDVSATQQVDPRTGLPSPVKLFVFLHRTPFWDKVYALIDVHFWRKPSVSTTIPNFLLIAALAVGLVRRRDIHALLCVIFIIGTVMYHMLVHAAVQFTEFGRYRLPVQPLWWSFVFCAFLTLGAELVAKVWPRTESAPSAERSR